MASGEHDLNLVAAYLEDRLDAAERARATAHFASCVQCRSILAEYARASVAARHDASPEGSVHPWFRQTRVWLPAAAAVMLTTVAVVSVLRRGSDPAAPIPADVQRPADPVSPPNPDARAVQPQPGVRSGNDASPAPAGEDDLVRRRSGQRIVDGKTFRLVAGEWVDQAYDPLEALREVEVRSSDERNGLLKRVPALRPFAALGPRVIVVHNGTVYKFGPDPLQ